MIPSSARLHHEERRRTALATVQETSRLWRRMGDEFDLGWAGIGEQVTLTVMAGMQQSAELGIAYTASQADGSPLADLDVAAFSAADHRGLPLEDTLQGAVVQTRLQVAAGATTALALAAGGSWLAEVVGSEVVRANSAAMDASIALTPTITGYVRMLNPPSCKDCILLAGKWFRWNQGFQRHLRCDCQHIPAGEDAAGDLRTDPYAMFQSMSEEERIRTFGRSNARAISEGADIYRVVNIENRGLASARAGRLYGTPTRATVDELLSVAGTRTNFQRLLEEHGYITGPQVRGGNVVGRFRERFQAPISRGIVRGSARDRVLQARATGVRDPLDRATMIAAERRLYDAWYRVEYARRTGFVPRAIGASSADRYASRQVLTPDIERRLREELETQMAVAASGVPSVRALRRLLEQALRTP